MMDGIGGPVLSTRLCELKRRQFNRAALGRTIIFQRAWFKFLFERACGKALQIRTSLVMLPHSIKRADEGVSTFREVAQMTASVSLFSSTVNWPGRIFKTDLSDGSGCVNPYR
jgi:hypothetical protein